MKLKTLRNIKVISLLTILLCAIFTTLSCDNLFSDVTTNYTPTSDTTSPAGDGNRTVTITGTISNPYERARNNSRSAMPSYAYSDKKYVVTATASGGSGTVSGTGNTTDNTFAIPLSLGKTWTINVQLLKKETGNTGGTGDTDYVKVMEGSYTFTEALTELVSGINIEIKPSITSDGTGKIALNFATPTEQLYDSVFAEPVSAEQKAAWSNAGVTADTNGITSTNRIKSGVYSVTISFYKSNVLVYTTMQEITVYNNMTTNMWDGSGSNGPINSGTFTVTQALIDTFKRTSIFVASTTNNPAGSNANSGTPYKPLASISKALQYISVTGNGEAYTIWLMSNITESVELTTDTITTSKASSITIRPMQNPVTVTGRTRTVFEVETSVPITFENLTITGGTATFSGGGMYIENGAEVTLANCTITGNSVTGSGSVGGGIFNSGTLKIKGKTNVTGNTSGSDADVKTDNIFLPDDKNITVSGTLDEDSRIGVTTATKPGYGSPVAFTTEFHANSGLSDTAISNIFLSDEGYAVVASSSGEATLQASGGNINNVFDYAVTLSCEDEEVVPGSIVTVTAAVTNGDTPVTPAAEDITWNFELLCYGDTVATLQGVSLVGYGAVTIPSDLKIFDGVTYTLHAKAVVNGVAYDEDFALIGNSDTLSAQGFVAVTGATVNGAVDQSQVFTTESSFTIPNLYVCDHEVTQAEFTAVMGFNTSSHDGSSGNQTAEGEKQKNRPVDCVNWYTALVYCNKRSRSEGLTPCYTINNSTNPDEWGVIPTEGYNATWDAVTCNFNANGYRLPKIEEWEYVARGGNGLTGTQYKYSGSDTLANVAWYGTDEAHGGTTHEVKKKQPNALQIYDMCGNVWEWCWDAANGNSRYARGGNFWRSAAHSELNYKGFSDLPFNGGTGDGFRVVRTASGLTYIGSKAPSEPKAVGDIVFYDGSATPYLSGLTLTDAQKNAAIAVIFYVGTGLNNAGDTTTVRTLGVGLQQSETELAWTAGNAENINISTVNENDKNGSDNLEQIGQFLAQNGSTDDTGDASKYPAFYYAKNYKDVTGSHVAGTAYESGWYLPSSSELTQVYLAKGTVNAAIALCGGKQFGSDEQDPFYRTSTQNSAAATNCFQINFSDGTTTNYRKNYTHDNYLGLYFGYSSAIREF